MTAEEKLAQLEAALKKRDDENAQLIAQLEEARVTGNVPVVIPGTLDIKGVESPDGKKSNVKVQFADGLVTIGFRQNRVNSAALMKEANGEELSPEEKAKNPVLAKTTKEEAVEWFKTMIGKGANIFKFLTLVLGLMLVFSLDADAQRKTVGDGRFGHYPAEPSEVDTLATDSTITWDFPSEIQDLDTYEWHFQPYADVLANTATITFTIYEALDPKNDHYYPTDTITVSSLAAANPAHKQIYRGDLSGSKLRIVATQSGAGATTQLRWAVRIRKKLITTVISQ